MDKGKGKLLGNWSEMGVLIAHPLFQHIKIAGASKTAANLRQHGNVPVITQCIRI